MELKAGWLVSTESKTSLFPILCENLSIFQINSIIHSIRWTSSNSSSFYSNFKPICMRPISILTQAITRVNIMEFYIGCTLRLISPAYYISKERLWFNFFCKNNVFSLFACICKCFCCTEFSIKIIKMKVKDDFIISEWEELLI